MQRIKRNDFSGGINNVAQVERIPANQVRDLVNLDPLPDGRLEARADAVKISDTGAERIWGLGADLYMLQADGHLLRRDTERDTEHELDGVQDLGAWTDAAGLQFHDRLIIGSNAALVHCRNGASAQLRIPAIGWSLSAASGALPAGEYRICLRAELDDPVSGPRQGGGMPRIIRIVEGEAPRIDVTLDPGVRMRLYASPANMETLYDQGVLTGSRTLTQIRTDTARLTNPEADDCPEQAALLALSDGVLASVATVDPSSVESRFLLLHLPLQPHLINRMFGYVPMPEAIREIHGFPSGLLIFGAEKTYRLYNLNDPTQISLQVLDEYPAVPGSVQTLPDQRVTWLSPRGQTYYTPGAGISRPTEGSYHPETAEHAAAGLIEHNGVQMAATTLTGKRESNALAARDVFSMEIIR